MTIDFNNYVEIDSNSPSGLVWKVSASFKVNVGQKAGWFDNSNKYWKVQILGKNYYTHRIIYEIYTCDKLLDNTYEIDHLDGNRSNNNINNLRKVTRSINSRNIKKRTDNKSGITGISFDKIENRWVVRWTINNEIKTKTFSCKNIGVDESFNNAVHFNTEIRNNLIDFHDYTGRNFNE